MRITSQTTDFSVKPASTSATAPAPATNTAAFSEKSSEQSAQITTQTLQQLDKPSLKDKLEPAIETINEVLETTNKTSKFVLHEGLDKYFVRLVDANTDEVIKEIPPERLLNAFYELQKLAGMIVDEKI